MPARKYATDEERAEAKRAACRRWRAAHPDRQAAATKAWLAANPEAPERYRATRRAKTAARPKRPRITLEERRTREREWRRANPEAVAASRKKWADANREKMAAIRVASNHKRGLVKVSGDLTAKDWEEILEAFQHRCAYCLKQAKLEPDHVVPISAGGGHTRDNIVPACRRCNASKGAKSLLAFLMAA